MNEILRAALGYRDRGWSVLPVGPDKRPLIKWGWLQKEIASEKIIRRWFSSGSRAGVGVIAGKISGLVILDIERSGNRLLDPPSTLTALSQSLGAHYYYNYREGDLKGLFRVDGRHIADTRGNGGYVVAPPTRGIKGLYQWINAEPICDPPEWLFRSPQTESTCCPRSVTNAPDFLSGNSYLSRSERIMAIARRVLSSGGDRDSVYNAVMNDWSGSKLRERSSGLAHRYIDQTVARARELMSSGLSGEIAWLTILAVWRSRSVRGDRLTLRCETDDGRVVRQGITLIPGTPRTEAFNEVVPEPHSGARFKAELFQTMWNGQPVWRVRRFLEGEG